MRKDTPLLSDGNFSSFQWKQRGPQSSTTQGLVLGTCPLKAQDEGLGQLPALGVMGQTPPAKSGQALTAVPTPRRK